MISEKEIKHIAELARLGLRKEEIKKMQKELSLILDYFNLLKEINAAKEIKIEKMPDGAMREDTAKKQSLEVVDKLTKAAPQKERDCFKVKSVF